MEIVEFKGTNMTLTEAIKDYVVEKLGRTANLLDGVEPADAQLDLGKTTNHHQKGDIFRAEINLQIPGATLRADAMSSDLYAAIDEMSDRIRTQVHKWKETRN
jgi:putative sigma-54 modulation protein